MRESKIRISAEDQTTQVFNRVAESFDRLERRMDSMVSTAKKVAAAFIGFQAAKGVLGWLEEGAKANVGDNRFTAYEKALTKTGQAWDRLKSQLGGAADNALGKLFAQAEPLMDRGIETMYRMATVVGDVLIPALAQLLTVVDGVFIKGMHAGAQGVTTANTTMLNAFGALAKGITGSLMTIEQSVAHWQDSWNNAVNSAAIQVLRAKDVIINNAINPILEAWHTAQQTIAPSKETLEWEKRSTMDRERWVAENRRPDLTGMTDEKLAGLIAGQRASDPRRKSFAASDSSGAIDQLQKELAKGTDRVFDQAFWDRMNQAFGAIDDATGSPSGIRIPRLAQFRPGMAGSFAGGAGGRGGSGGTGTNTLESHYLAGTPTSAPVVTELQKANVKLAQHLEAVIAGNKTANESNTTLRRIEKMRTALGVQGL